MIFLRGLQVLGTLKPRFFAVSDYSRHNPYLCMNPLRMIRARKLLSSTNQKSCPLARGSSTRDFTRVARPVSQQDEQAARQFKSAYEIV